MTTYACPECGAPAGVTCAPGCATTVTAEITCHLAEYQATWGELNGDDTPVVCLRCHDPLGVDNQAATCTEHPMCVGCDDPHDTSCIECVDVRRDHADDHATEQQLGFARDERAA